MALAADGLVLAVDLVDVLDSNQQKIGAQFIPTSAHNVGQPQRLAVSHDGKFLFITDGASNVLKRLDLTSTTSNT